VEREVHPAAVPVAVQLPKLAQQRDIRAVPAVPVVGQAQILQAEAQAEEQGDRVEMAQRAELQILPPKMVAAVAAMAVVPMEA
jgi:hypothetical protein